MRNILKYVIAVVAIVGAIGTASAFPQYVDVVKNSYGIDSCQSCHINYDGGSLNQYGQMFQNQMSINGGYPGDAAMAIGRPDVFVSTNVYDRDSWIPSEGDSCWSSGENFGRCSGRAGNSFGHFVGQVARGFVGGLFNLSS